MIQDQRRSKIEGFLNCGAWLIGSDRVKTKRALIETLESLPEIILDSIFADVRVLVIAPELSMAGCVVPYGCVAQRGSETRFQVAIFDCRLEDYEYERTLRIVQSILRHCFSRLAGMEAAVAGPLEFSGADEAFLRSLNIAGGR